MLSSRRGKQPVKRLQAQHPKQEKRSVYIVFATTTNKETGAQLSRQNIGIFENQEDAEKLEKGFNDQEQRSEEVVTKAFSMRYALPYVAPMVKELMERK